MAMRLWGYLRRHHLALLALVVALGGSAYAAAKLPSKSVGKKQLQAGAVTAKAIHAGAVTSKAVQDHSLQALDFAANQLPQGPTGPAGPSGVAGVHIVTADSVLDTATNPKVAVAQCGMGETAIAG